MDVADGLSVGGMGTRDSDGEKIVVFAERGERFKGGVAVERGLAKFGDAAQFALKEAALQVESGIVSVAVHRRRHNDKIVDGCLVLTGSFAEQTAATLDELARVARTGEEETGFEGGQVDALVETANGHHSVEKTAAEIAQYVFALGGLFLIGEGANAKVVLVAQELGDGLDLALILGGYVIGDAAIAAVKQGPAGLLRQAGKQRIELGELIGGCPDEASPLYEQTHGTLA